MLIVNQAKKPPDCCQFCNQTNTWLAVVCTDRKARTEKSAEVTTATTGRPFDVHLVKMMGA